MKGKAAIAGQPREAFEFRDYPVPEVGPDDILVKVKMASICGSDLHGWEGKFPGIIGAPGTIPGHEMFGEVFEQGHNVRNDTEGNLLERGDRIAYSYFRPCNECISCLHGVPGCAPAGTGTGRRHQRSIRTSTGRTPSITT